MEAFADLVWSHGAEWMVGQTATGRWWAVRPGDEPGGRPVALHADSPGQLGAILRARAAAGSCGQ